MPDKKDTTQSELVDAHVRIFRRGDRWHANFQHDGKQCRVALKTTNKKEARRKAAQIDADLGRGDYELTAKAPAVEDVIAAYCKYLVAEGRAEKTLTKYDHVFGLVRDLVPRRKVKSILDINQAFIDTFRAERVANGAAPKTVHTDTTIIRQLVKFAMRRDMISRDPLKGLKLSKPKPTPQPCWTRDQLQRIIAAATEPYRSMFIVLGATGMRVGELKHLTWDDVDLDRVVIHIRPKEDWRPKTGDIRIVPISTQLGDVFERLPHKAKWVFTAQLSRRYPKGDHHISERRLLEYLKRVLARLGLQGHLHTFRHTFISLALTSGTPEAVVREWVGHVDDRIIRHYTHIADKASQAAMQAVADSLGADLVPGDRDDYAAADRHSAQFQHNREEADDDDGAK